MAIHRPPFAQFGIVILVTNDPQAGRRPGCLRLHGGFDLIDAAQVHIRASHFIGAIGMAVRIDKPGCDGRAGPIDHFCVGSLEGIDVRIGPGGNESVAQYSDSFNQWPGPVHGVNTSALDDQISLDRAAERLCL
jgi:hypothetical protein